MRNLFFASVAMLAISAAAEEITPSPQAVWETSSWWESDFSYADNNILRVSSLDAENSRGLANTHEGSKSYGTLTDGEALRKDNTSKTTCLANKASLTYVFPKAYSVKEVRIYSTWADAGRDTLSVDSIQAITAAGEEKMLSPGPVSYSGDGFCAKAVLKMDDDSILCSDVKKIVFNFGDQEHDYVGYGELEVVVAEEFGISSVIEIPADETVTAMNTPEDHSIYGLNGGNLVISGVDTVVVQNVPMKNKMADEDFKDYWPWIKGTVTVEKGATLKSNTILFRGQTVPDPVTLEGRNAIRKLVVNSGATAEFSPNNKSLDIISVKNGAPENAWVLVEGAGSKILFPSTVYFGKKSQSSTDGGHEGRLDVLDGGYVEGGRLNVGHDTGRFLLTVDGGRMKWSDGIFCYNEKVRWAGGGAKILFKNSEIETTFYKMRYPVSNGDCTVTFDGALFKPAGTPAAMFIDASPIGDEKCPHILTGGGLIIDAPEGNTLEVSAMLQGDGGFTKRGLGTVIVSATNEFTGVTLVSEGTLELTGRVAGAIEVKSGATLALAIPDQSDVPLAASVTVEEGGSLSAVSQELPEGVRSVDVLRTGESIVLPDIPNDEAGNCFFVSRRNGEYVLRYGRRLGFTVIVK